MATVVEAVCVHEDESMKPMMEDGAAGEEEPAAGR